MVIFLLAMVALFYGLYLTVFRRRKRKRGLLVIVLSLGVMGFSAVANLNNDARAKGFANWDDEYQAQKAGILDPAVWRRQRAAALALAEASRIEAEKAAEAKAQTELAEKQAAEIAAAAAEAKALSDAAAQKERDQEYGFHCLSPWDGSQTAFVEAVQAQLNDPESFVHVKTVTWPKSADGRNKIMMTFRAKNGFGGVITTRATGTFDNANCSAVELENIDQ